MKRHRGYIQEVRQAQGLGLRFSGLGRLARGSNTQVRTTAIELPSMKPHNSLV